MKLIKVNIHFSLVPRIFPLPLPVILFLIYCMTEKVYPRG
ncbi:hypothetical protein BN132_1552 [Cronobacter turicensis 564]|nr:hypothetical protein BN132_1552 [Cronobacter turicensis 564]